MTAGAGRPRRETGITGGFSADLAERPDAARELVACLPHLSESDRRLVAVLCGTLLEVEAARGSSAASAVIEQIAMVVGARRLGDG